MTKDQIRSYVLSHIMNNPGCLATDITAALRKDQVDDPTHGKYNHVAWAVRALRNSGSIKDDLPKCVECRRILNRAPRPLYLSDAYAEAANGK